MHARLLDPVGLLLQRVRIHIAPRLDCISSHRQDQILLTSLKIRIHRWHEVFVQYPNGFGKESL